MTANEFIKKTRKITVLPDIGFGISIYEEKKPRVICADGYSVSMQVGHGMYCTPRVDGAEYYTEVELGYPSAEDDLINDYAEEYENFTNTVYPYVPIAVVDRLFEKHGGIVNFD